MNSSGSGLLSQADEGCLDVPTRQKEIPKFVHYGNDPRQSCAARIGLGDVACVELPKDLLSIVHLLDQVFKGDQSRVRADDDVALAQSRTSAICLELNGLRVDQQQLNLVAVSFEQGQQNGVQAHALSAARRPPTKRCGASAKSIR